MIDTDIKVCTLPGCDIIIAPTEGEETERCIHHTPSAIKSRAIKSAPKCVFDKDGTERHAGAFRVVNRFMGGGASVCADHLDEAIERGFDA